MSADQYLFQKEEATDNHGNISACISVFIKLPRSKVLEASGCMDEISNLCQKALFIYMKILIYIALQSLFRYITG
ncbi:hypothetical protein ACX6C2_003071 [Listeria monocytogenes]